MAPKHFLTSNFRVAFEEYFNPEQQIRAVNDLKAHIADVQDGSEEKRRELGVLRPQDTTAEQQDTRIAAHLDKCHWQLAQLYRVSFSSLLGLRCPPSPYIRADSRAAVSDVLFRTVLQAMPHRRGRGIPSTSNQLCA